jgi:transposase InsO family protein
VQYKSSYTLKLFESYDPAPNGKGCHQILGQSLEDLTGAFSVEKSSFEEFINWYNDRPHGSLNFLSLETPEMAFRPKMPLEAYFAVGHRLFGL